MTPFQEIAAAAEKMSAQDLLRFAIKDKFPGRSVVTASLRARSVAAVAMVAEIDPSTPIVFCQPSALFPESLDYRSRLVRRLGLSDVSVSTGREPEVRPSDRDHFECMWVDDPVGGGRVHEIVHLNETLGEFDCWISAVYHVPKSPRARHKVDVDGRLIRIDPLIDWSEERVRMYLRQRGIPLHPRAVTARPAAPVTEGEASVVYCY
ncbi:MAG: phosphoadenosine phosphosulfate reductase family protein [Rhodospirillales bacterium]|nr:phosphoadenosine phosphosulfate reductase family protein [Rhodospirillales bacterium]